MPRTVKKENNKKLQIYQPGIEAATFRAWHYSNTLNSNHNDNLGKFNACCHSIENIFKSAHFLCQFCLIDALTQTGEVPRSATTIQKSGLGICSFAHRSDQMSDCERFPQITQDKWATVSDSLQIIWLISYFFVRFLFVFCKFFK